MKVYLREDIEKIGLAGEIVKVSEGYARNFLFPRNLAIEVTATNENFYKDRIKEVKNRKEVIETKTSMLAERIGTLKITLKRKMHDDGKLYGAISAGEIVDALAAEGISIAKNQVIFDKSIKAKGTHEVTIKLTARLQPKIKVVVQPE